MNSRTVERIDRDLATHCRRRRDTLNQLVTAMSLLNAIDHRIDQLLAERSRAAVMAAHPSTGGAR